MPRRAAGGRRRPWRRLRRAWLRRLAGPAAIAPLYAAWMSFVWRTSRIEDAGLGRVRGIVAEQRGCVALLWHEDVLLAPWACGRLGLRPTTLVSVSDAGEVAARILERCGFRVLRGGSSRRASRRRPLALRALIRHARQEPRTLCALAVDGSGGPRRALKPGGLALARATGLPIALVRCASRPSLRLPTWDRLAVPLPFGRIRLELRGPFPTPPDAATRAGLERFRVRLEQELLGMARAGERARLGGGPPFARRAGRGLPPPAFGSLRASLALAARALRALAGTGSEFR